MYLTFYHGPYTRPEAEVIVQDVPPQLAKHLAKALSIELVAQRWAYLHRIWVRSALRHYGHGTSLLKEMLRATDALGLSLALRCAPFDNQDGSKRGLRRWYAEHGFQQLGAHRPDIMIRRFTF